MCLIGHHTFICPHDYCHRKHIHSFNLYLDVLIMNICLSCVMRLDNILQSRPSSVESGLSHDLSCLKRSWLWLYLMLENCKPTEQLNEQPLWAFTFVPLLRLLTYTDKCNDIMDSKRHLNDRLTSWLMHVTALVRLTEEYPLAKAFPFKNRAFYVPGLSLKMSEEPAKWSVFFWPRLPDLFICPNTRSIIWTLATSWR